MSADLCEHCGESAAYVHTGESSLCEDCYSDSVRETLLDAGFGQLCARFLRLENGNHALCLEPYGVEHDHS